MPPLSKSLACARRVLKSKDFEKGFEARYRAQARRPATLKGALVDIVVAGGVVNRDDRIGVIIPRGPHRALKPV
jgi:hypothetical protein